MTDDDWRVCVGGSTTHPDDCPYAIKKAKVDICGIDSVVGVKWFGCTPSEIKNFTVLKKAFLDKK